MKKGYTLIEIMIVTSIFAVLALLVSGVILQSVRNTQKSESLSNVRAELDNVVLVMERHLRNSDNMVGIGNTGDILSGIQYTDTTGVEARFVCMDDVGLGIVKVASQSTEPNWNDTSFDLTSDKVNVLNCNFSVEVGTYDIPDKVEVTIEAEAAGITGVESGEVKIETILNLRNY